MTDLKAVIQNMTVKKAKRRETGVSGFVDCVFAGYRQFSFWMWRWSCFNLIQLFQVRLIPWEKQIDIRVPPRREINVGQGATWKAVK